MRQRIGIIGTGAIGGFYGLMLARAGHDVHFLLRSEYSVVAQRGLSLNSAVYGELHSHPVQAWNRAEDMPSCEWLLVGAKTTSNAELAPIIARVGAPGCQGGSVAKWPCRRGPIAAAATGLAASAGWALLYLYTSCSAGRD